MKRFLFFLAYGLFSVVLESTLLQNLPTYWLKFNFLLLGVVFVSLNYDWRTSFPIVMAMGILMDSASYAPLGTAICSYFILFLLIRWFSKQLELKPLLALTSWVMIFSAIYKVLNFSFIYLFTSHKYFSFLSFFTILGQALWDGCLALILFPMFKLLEQVIRKTA